MADVIVMGAGPAGNGAAYRLAALGHDVVVLEYREQIGDKLCTGIVGGECIERFGPVKPRVLHELWATTFVLPSGKTIRIDMGRPYAYVIDRVHFVTSLALKAQQAGAVYPLNRRVTGVAVDGEGVTVRAVSAGGEEVFKGRALVLATGFASRFTKALGLGTVEDFVFGVQAEVRTEGLMETELYLGRRVAPGFFGWATPTSDGHALVGLLARRSPINYLKYLISNLRAQGKVVEVTGKPGKWGIPLTPLPRTYSERVLVVGDAAGQVKPTTGGGIYYSLLCAELAAETLHKALALEDLSARRLREYETLWKKRLGRELRVGFYARRIYEALGDRQVEYLMNTIARNGIHRDIVQGRLSSFDWHAELILKGMSHRAIRGVIEPLKSLVPFWPWPRGG